MLRTILLLVASHAAATCTRTKVEYAGVNLYGLAADVNPLGSAYTDFNDVGVCNASYTAYPFNDPPQHYYDWHSLGFNLFRIPMAWQHVVNHLGGPLNETTIAQVDTLVNTITGNGSTSILDIHNYARWYCSIIGQAENNLPHLSTLNVTDKHFVDLWVKLANRYKDNSRIMFQLMNEPHDLNMTKWAHTNQKVIHAIRATGATQRILISGGGFARLRDWEDFSMAALSTVTDPMNNLIYDFHQYFDDAAGAYGVCLPWDGFLPAYTRVTRFVRESGKKAIMTEFGGAPVTSCVTLFTSMLQFFEDNSDVWLGWTAWGSYNPGDLYLDLNKTSPYGLLPPVLAKFVPLV